MKKILLCSLFSVASSLAFAQGLADRYIGSLGNTYFLDYASTPVASEVINPGSFDAYTEYHIDQSFSLFTIVYTARLNVLEPSDNFALSANVVPALGIAFSEAGYGSINVPLTINADFGAGATYHTTRDVGGTFGVGLEYNKIGLISKEGVDSAFKTSWMQPVVTTGVRYWNKKNKMREINLKFGMGGAQDYREYQSDDLTSRRSLTARVVFISFLNY